MKVMTHYLFVILNPDIWFHLLSTFGGKMAEKKCPPISVALPRCWLVGVVRSNRANTSFIMSSMMPSNASLNKFKRGFMNPETASPATRPEHHRAFMGICQARRIKYIFFCHHRSEKWTRFISTKVKYWKANKSFKQVTPLYKHSWTPLKLFL